MSSYGFAAIRGFSTAATAAQRDTELNPGPPDSTTGFATRAAVAQATEDGQDAEAIMARYFETLRGLPVWSNARLSDLRNLDRNFEAKRSQLRQGQRPIFALLEDDIKNIQQQKDKLKAEGLEPPPDDNPGLDKLSKNEAVAGRQLISRGNHFRIAVGDVEKQIEVAESLYHRLSASLASLDLHMQRIDPQFLIDYGIESHGATPVPEGQKSPPITVAWELPRVLYNKTLGPDAIKEEEAIQQAKEEKSKDEGRKKRKRHQEEETTGVVPEEVENEQKPYCVCGEGSWGDMVGCDNSACPLEWFHLHCVGLDEAPEEGRKWYCTRCLSMGIPLHSVTEQDEEKERKKKKKLVEDKKKLDLGTGLAWMAGLGASRWDYTEMYEKAQFPPETLDQTDSGIMALLEQEITEEALQAAENDTEILHIPADPTSFFVSDPRAKRNDYSSWGRTNILLEVGADVVKPGIVLKKTQKSNNLVAVDPIVTSTLEKLNSTPSQPVGNVDDGSVIDVNPLTLKVRQIRRPVDGSSPVKEGIKLTLRMSGSQVGTPVTPSSGEEKDWPTTFPIGKPSHDDSVTPQVSPNLKKKKVVKQVVTYDDLVMEKGDWTEKVKAPSLTSLEKEAQELLKRERLMEQDRLKLAKQQSELDLIERERIRQERLEKERLEREKMEKEEKERAERLALAAEKAVKERLAAEAERLEKERVEAEERMEKEREEKVEKEEVEEVEKDVEMEDLESNHLQVGDVEVVKTPPRSTRKRNRSTTPQPSTKKRKTESQRDLLKDIKEALASDGELSDHDVTDSEASPMKGGMKKKAKSRTVSPAPGKVEKDKVDAKVEKVEKVEESEEEPRRSRRGVKDAKEEEKKGRRKKSSSPEPPPRRSKRGQVEEEEKPKRGKGRGGRK